jgi:microcystin-dependent protein
MSEPFLGEIQMFAFNFPPKNWALCNGQIMSISQNTALFSLLGTTYGGNGVTTFALPDLRGRIPFHSGNGFTLGQIAGEEQHTLINSEMPAHTHQAACNTNTGTGLMPTNNFWAGSSANPYATTGGGLMSAAAVGTSGGSQPHNNMPPFLVISFCIALTGDFPSRN